MEEDLPEVDPETSACGETAAPPSGEIQAIDRASVHRICSGQVKQGTTWKEGRSKTVVIFHWLFRWGLRSAQHENGVVRLLGLGVCVCVCVCVCLRARVKNCFGRATRLRVSNILNSC